MGSRFVGAIELKGKIDLPEDYIWLHESEIAHLLKTGQLHDAFLEAASVFALHS